MGFMSRYEGTERIDLGDGYWVDVKKCLSVAEAREAEHVGMQWSLRQDPKTEKAKTDVTIDPEAKLFEQVLASVVDWNVDDEKGAKWPLEHDPTLEAAQRKAGRPNWQSPRRKSLDKLPKPAFDAIAAFVGKANRAATRDEEGSFRAGGGSGDTVLDDDPPDHREVLDGAGLLAGVGGPGGPASSD